jgi:hypothetical protein
MLPSLSPTNLSVVPLPGVGVEVRATFHDANTSDGTYARFEVSTDNTFAATDYDSGQVAITPITDGAEGIMVFTFIPLAAGTYYYRLCFWDDINYTKTTWLVWNGTVVSNTPKVGYIRPSSDNSVAIETVFPAAPTTHFDKVDEITHNDDTDYVETAVGTPKDQTDLYNLGDLSDVDFKDINSIAVNAYCKLTGGAGLSAVLYLKIITHATPYSIVAINIDVDGAYVLIGPWTHATNPFTTVAWTLDEVNDLIAGIRHYINGASLHLRTTQLYVEINYNIYVFTFTPPGNNILSIGFPSITSVEVDNDKDKYTFDVVISDSYLKPPIVTLSTGNDTEVMDYVNRTGSGPYSYTFSKTVSLERGDYEYHIEIGNVWTLIIDSIRFLHANYNLNQEPKIEIFVGNQKIETWNHLLTENILPDLPEIEFDSEENIQSFDITVRFTKNDFREYNMEIQGISKIPEGYHIRAKEVANRDLEQVITFASQAVNSLTLLKSLLPGYIFTGDLPEIIYLQAFLDEKILDIFKRLLILNYAIGYIRNKKIYLYDLENTNALFKMNVVDAQIGYDSDPSVIINKVREYYIRKMYPVPENIFTNYDATNWLGVVLDARQTVNGILPLSGSLYCLKGTGTISRILDFLWSDFDQLNMNWCPDTATTLEIRLETDAGNYRKYIRTFSGQKGSGFVLTSSQATDVVVKTLTFADKYVNLITGIVTKQCSYKIELKLDGIVVYTMDWEAATGLFGKAFANTLCDTIEISFTNLYPVGVTYGIDCSNLVIEEYKQVYEITGVTVLTTWHSRYSGSTHLNWTYDAPSSTWSGTTHEEYGAVSPCVGDETYAIKINHSYIYASLGKPKVGGGMTWTNFHLGVGIGVGVDERGILVADFSCEYSLEDPTWVINLGSVNYSFDVNKILNDFSGEWVWKYATYAWAEVYNLWDSLSIPFSLFTTVGTPTNQINTIRLMAADDNWYDTIYCIKNTPVPQYVEAENAESMAKGIKFQERKLDGWSSKESALAFAKAFVNLFGDPAESYSKQMSMQTDINIGDMVDCDGTILPVYKIVYDLNAGQMTVFVGRSVTDTLEWLKETSRKIEAIEKVIY